MAAELWALIGLLSVLCFALGGIAYCALIVGARADEQDEKARKK